MPKKFSVITIFPDMIRTYLGFSILKKAIDRGAIDVGVINLRDFTSDRHKTVDDYPYGGGVGMVMKPDPFFEAVETTWPDRASRRVVLLSPQGRPFVQRTAAEFAADDREIVFLCGRYEAIDERVRTMLSDDVLSTGDYILTGGELPSLVIIDAVSRLVPGVLGDFSSTEDESFSRGLLDYPHFTRPENFRGSRVPDVLLSGNHREIARWRTKESLRATLRNRPDMMAQASLSKEEIELLEEIKEEQQ
ncbi:MAG: tRNA (guanosine(37)-N1)-methyltransferase TrmD [Thermodesulfovibrionales bacterium]